MSVSMGGNARVLVVEDSPDLRDLLGLQLQFGGYEAICAHDGAEALSRIENVDPAIVLSDVLMPAMSGTELARRLRTIPRFAETPVVLYTGINADDAELVETAAMPNVHVISKGASMMALLATVGELLRTQVSGLP